MLSTRSADADANADADVEYDAWKGHRIKLEHVTTGITFEEDPGGHSDSDD